MKPRDAESSLVHGSVTDGYVSVPSKLTVIDGHLLSKGMSRWKRISPAMLDDFLDIALTSSPEDKVLAFARRYGTLELCEHNKPAIHSRVHPLKAPPGSQCCNEVRASLADWQFAEPVATWISYARRARAMWDVADAIRARRTPDDKQVHLAMFGDKAQSLPVLPLRVLVPSHFRSNADAAAVLLQGLLFDWVCDSGIRPFLWWRDGRWTISHTTGPVCSTLGAITAQLMLRVAGSSGFSICSACRESYPARRIDPTRRNYCDKPECQQAAWRDSKRDRRAGKTPRWKRPDLSKPKVKTRRRG